jgi:hypothetical protein
MSFRDMPILSASFACPALLEARWPQRLGPDQASLDEHLMSVHPPLGTCHMPRLFDALEAWVDSTKARNTLLGQDWTLDMSIDTGCDRNARTVQDPLQQ